MNYGYNRGHYYGYSDSRSGKVGSNPENRSFKRKTYDERCGDAKRFKSYRGRGNYKNAKWNEKGYKKNQNKQRERDRNTNESETKYAKGEMSLINLVNNNCCSYSKK